MVTGGYWNHSRLVWSKRKTTDTARNAPQAGRQRGALNTQASLILLATNVLPVPPPQAECRKTPTDKGLGKIGLAGVSPLH